MQTRKTQYGWMALGGLICLFVLVLACKLRDGNKAVAQDEKHLLPPMMDSKDASPPPKPEMLKKLTKEPPFLLTAQEPSGLPKQTGKKSTPTKATLDMPMPVMPPPNSPPALSPPLPPPSTVKPASFGLNEPTPPLSLESGGMGGSITKPRVGLPPPLDPLSSSPRPRPGQNKEDKPTPPPSSLESLRTLMKNTTPDNSTDTKLSPTAFAPMPPATPPSIPDHETAKTAPGEPPLAPLPGPVQIYHAHGTETLQDIARRTLGSSERSGDLHKLNPALNPDAPLRAGTAVRLPADACVQADEVEPIKPLPILRPKLTPPKSKVLPLTGTYQCSLDEKGQLTLPRSLRDQLNGCDTVLLSPGPDRCLWLTNQAHLERLGERLDQSQANEADVRVFKRLYFAQTEKLPVNDDGRVAVTERLAQFAGLHQEVVLVGIDDHFEVWDAARWRQYTQQKSTGRATSMVDPE